MFFSYTESRANLLGFLCFYTVVLNYALNCVKIV